MPTYAGFASFHDYLSRRFKREKINQNVFAEAMKWRRNYVHYIFHEEFIPSSKRCEKIADFFGDDPSLVKILAGRESPPPDPADNQLRQIYSLAYALTTANRGKTVKIISRLLNEQKPKRSR